MKTPYAIFYICVKLINELLHRGVVGFYPHIEPMQKVFNGQQIAKKIIKLLTKPFSEELPFLLLTLLLISLPTICFYIRTNCMVYAGYTLMASICVSYLLTFVISLARGWLGKLLKTLLLFLIGIHFIFDIFCVMQFQSCLNDEFIAILLGTNPGEITEFIDTFVDGRTIAILVFAFSMCALSAWIIRKVKLPRNAQYAGVAMVLVFAALSLRNNAVFRDTFAGHIFTLCCAEEIPDLRQYYSSPSLTLTEDAQPQNIVLIIGESFSKYHSSLFGYEKRTNPRLEALRDSSLLYTYPKVKAPALNTIAAFKHFMSTWNTTDNAQSNDKEWYTFTTIPEIAALCDYKSYWISNQSKTGLFDNIVGKYADLCDCNMFVGNKYSGMMRKNLDEEVLPLLRKRNTTRKEADKTKNFYFIHLMGSHEGFSVRYPANRKYFKESEYEKFPKLQRKNRADYDNSILYNDSVVNEIIRQFEDKEAIVIYFSDHALDVYQSSDNYCAHAKINNSVSRAAGEAIPFMVYTSHKYQRKFPEMTQRIKSSVNKSVSTDKLIYSVMDIIGVKFTNNDDVANYSIFK